MAEMKEKNSEKRNHIRIGGRDFALAFPLAALKELQEKIGIDLDKLQNAVHDVKTMPTVLCTLARYGAILEGGTLDVDEAWLEARIPPSGKCLLRIQLELMETMAAWMMMETEEEDEKSREIDLVLEEIEKKSGAGNLLGVKSSDGD